jgi:hypothetical protein
MTIRLLGGWPPATELIHIPKRAPDLDIGPSGGGPSRCSSQPMREGRRREGRRREGEGKEGREGICDTLQPFVVTLHGLAVG